jgi:hypothetical protein
MKTNTNEDIWCAIQCKLSNGLQNWDLKRPYTARLDDHVQEFTEEWEDPHSQEHPQDTLAHPLNDDDTEKVSQKQQYSSFENNNYHHPKCNVRLFQYRPAWLEQLVLRTGGVRHVVVNSPFAVTEATGPLPFLQDLDGGSASKDAATPPAMIGRQPTNGTAIGDNAILQYLKIHHGVDLDIALTTNDLLQQSALYTTILRDTLAPCLMAMRYQVDLTAWCRIYRPQCLKATSGSHNSWYNKPILAMWQSWSERIHAVSSLTSSQRMQSREEVIASARQTYAIFERQIRQQQCSSKNYLLGTEKPTTVDCLLWDHLMLAIADIHLVVVLADFPGLLLFLEHVWDTYSFGTAIDTNSVGSSSEWIWNLEENASNAFTEVPLIPAHRQANNGTTYTNAIDLMETLNLHQYLQVAKKQRYDRSIFVRQRQSFATWHRWRMGDGFFPKRKNAGNIQETVSGAAEHHARRQYQRNDEIWMASVSAATLVTILGFGLAGFSR